MNIPLSQDQIWLLTEKYHGEKTAGFFTDCERLAAGEPLAYIIGHIPFLNCTIYLDSHPLIPRPETEFWVEHAIQIIKTRVPRKGLGTTFNILDLCAGSGCIGVAIGQAIPEAHITFAEIDPAHLPTIEKNYRENIPAKNETLPETIVSSTINRTIVRSYLFDQVTGTFDFILSNPPYIDPALDRAQPSVKNYEPHLALYGGRDGSELLEKIIVAAPTFLTPHGQLWLEHEPEQVALIHALGTAQQFTVTHYPDQFGTLRYSQLVLQ